jgi:hypothetical protein
MGVRAVFVALFMALSMGPVSLIPPAAIAADAPTVPPVDLEAPNTIRCVFNGLQGILFSGKNYLNEKPSQSQLMRFVRHTRDETTMWFRTKFKFDNPISVMDNGTNVKADYLAKSLLGLKAQAEEDPALSSVEIQTEFNAQIQSVLDYKKNLDEMLDQESQDRLQIFAMTAALEKIKRQKITPPYRLWLPSVKNGEPSARAMDFNDQAQLATELGNLKSDLKILTTHNYSKVGSYRNLALNQQINIESLIAIRRYVVKAMNEAQEANPSMVLPQALADLRAKLDAILNPRNKLKQSIVVDGVTYKGGELAPPPMAIQRLDWQEFRKTIFSSTPFSKVTKAKEPSLLNKAVGKISGTAPAVDSSPIKNTYQNIVKYINGLTPQQKTALGLDRPFSYLALAQGSKWGPLVVTPVGLIWNNWLGISNGTYSLGNWIDQLFWSSDTMQMKTCAAQTTQLAYNSCIEKYINGKFLLQYMKQIEANNPGARVNYFKHEVLIDLSKVPDAASSNKAVIVKDPRSGNLLMSAQVSPSIEAGGGLSTDALTGALRIDSAQVPVGDSSAIVEKNAKGTVILHVDTLLTTGTGAILQREMAESCGFEV